MNVNSHIALFNIFLKVPATHLLTGALMSAPAALAVSKLSLPETEKKLGKNRKEDDIKMGNAGEMG